MENYPSNSIRSKENNDIPEKKVEKVITGNVKTKKRSEAKKFADVFITDDVENVKSYILMDVLVPAIKKALSDVVTNGIDMLLWGESRSRSRNTDSRPSYRSYYDRKDEPRRTVTPRTLYSVDDIILEHRSDAEDVLDSLMDILEEYQMVSVAELKDLVGINSVYTDNKYGWKDLRTARVERVHDGFIIKLPKPMPL